MAAKALMPNQCDVLHPIYGVHDCCLCNARSANNLLKLDIKFLVNLIECRWQPNLRDGLNKEYDDYATGRIESIKSRYLNQGI